MAGLTRGTTLSIDSFVTAGTLHTLIESALVSGITGTDLFGGNHFITVSTDTPNPSLNPLWYNPIYEDPILRVFATPFNIWLALGPDRFEIPLLNGSGGIVPMGALVVASNSGPSLFTIATSPSLNALGFLQATTADGAWGPVATCGIGWVLHISSPSLTSSQDPGDGEGIKAYGCPAGGIGCEGFAANGGSGPMYGVMLDNNRSGHSGSGSVFRALITGPKLTTHVF